MKILQLTVRSIKRIDALEINPADLKPIILTGDNTQGKSSVLDSIILALSNTGLVDPIRHGNLKGSVTVVLGSEKTEYVVTRSVTRSGTSLSLTNAEGQAIPKPQTFLNGLIGNYAFDPLEFTRLKDKEQVEALKSAAGLDFSEIDAKRKAAYDKRTDVGRDGAKAKALFESLTAPEEGLPAEEIQATELLARMEDHSAKALSLTNAKNALASADTELETAETEVTRCREWLAKAEAAEKAAAEKKKSAEQLVKDCESDAPDAETVAALAEQIRTSNETNAKIRAAAEYLTAKAAMKKLGVEYKALDREIEECDESKKDAIQKADLPLEGLEMTDDAIMFNGIVFSQLSTAEQIRISTLVAMSQNPTLKIIMIRDGALINRGNLKLIQSLANEKDYQIWIEKFQEDPSSEGFHIVDGAIAFEDGKPKTEQ